MKVALSAFLTATCLVAAFPANVVEHLGLDYKVNEPVSSLSLPGYSTSLLKRSTEHADLRIASKKARYDNNKSIKEVEVITLYVYNAGPDRAVAPGVRAGFAPSMDYRKVSTTLRKARCWHDPAQKIKDGSLSWTDLPVPSERVDGWDVVTTLPDIPPGTLVEINFYFPMTHENSYLDRTMKASVTSPTADPRTENNEAEYVITPNHHDDGQAYWGVFGNLHNLNSNALASTAFGSEADLRIVSARTRYNNALPYGSAESLTFFVFNDGPTTATQPRLTAGFTTSMDYNNMKHTVDQMWVANEFNPSKDIERDDWQPLQGANCRVEGWEVDCSLPDMPPKMSYRVKLTFPMTHETTYRDYTGTASISSQAKDSHPDDNSATYIITPNHNNDGEEYWKTGNIAQLDAPSTPSGSRKCETGWFLDTPIIVSEKNTRRDMPLSGLEKWVRQEGNQLMSYDIGENILKPRVANGVEFGTSPGAVAVSFSSDGENQLTYSALPDTLVYLEPTTIKIQKDDVRLGYWIPVRMLWPGAGIRGMAPDGKMTVSYVTDIQEIVASDLRSAQPHMVSRSHSYIVGTVKEGGILTHNPSNGLCGIANNMAMVVAAGLIAQNLVATTTPPPNVAPPRHGYGLRYRRPTDPPRPWTAHGPPVLPADVPRRDEDGSWLVYLYEEDTPAAVENARHGISEGLPWLLTYDPSGAHARRSLSLRDHPSQRELLQLTSEELTDRQGTGQLDRDEYPPAIAQEGGSGAFVTYIESSDNRRAGSLMAMQFSSYRANPQPDGHPPLAPGDRFRYAIIHQNMREVEYLGDGYTETQMQPPPS